MLGKYSDYIKENNNGTFDVLCKIDEQLIMKISGQNSLDDAILNEFGWTDSLIVMDYEKEGDNFIIKISPSDNIKELSDTTNIRLAIQKEFDWLIQSGIEFIKILN